MYEKLEECPSCKHTNFNNYLICKDNLVSQESFALVKCGKCQLVFTNPRPTQENIGQYYKSTAYISHTNKANNFINLAYKLVRNYTTTSKYRLIHKYVKEGKLLDYGCGTGYFLSKSKKFKTYGYDQDPDVLVTAKNHSSATILDSHTGIKKIDEFDVITAWHVIEHVHELRDTLKMLKKKLSTDGYMFAALPNLSSFDSKHYGADWAAYDVPRHLYHFNQDSLASLLKNLKLNLIDVVPMKFDAYYVAMLSEKNRPNGSLIQALKIASKSNKAASKNNNYSSLIYVISK